MLLSIYSRARKAKHCTASVLGLLTGMCNSTLDQRLFYVSYGTPNTTERCYLPGGTLWHTKALFRLYVFFVIVLYARLR